MLLGQRVILTSGKDAVNALKYLSITIMNPKNGEILDMINPPEYNPNKPSPPGKTSEEVQESWRSGVISDVFEPDS